MAVEPGREAAEGERGDGRAAAGVEALASATRLLALGEDPGDALQAIAEATAAATDADAVVVRSLDDRGQTLTARAVATASAAVAAELEGSRVALAELPADEVDRPELLPPAIRRAAARLGTDAVLQLPLVVGNRAVGTFELLRRAHAFTAAERALAHLAAGHAALALRAGIGDGAVAGRAGDVLELAGEALVAGSDDRRTAGHVAMLAAEASGATASLVWRFDDRAGLVLVATHGPSAEALAAEGGAEAAAQALTGREPLALSARAGGPVIATVQLGQPPLGVLQLFFDADTDVSERELALLAGFCARATNALRATERARRQAAELERARALLSLLGQAIAHLSLAHTLETATRQVADLLDAERVAVYLFEGDERRLYAAAGHGLAGPHLRIAECLLGLAVGRLRGRGLLAFEDARSDASLAPVHDAVTEAGIEAILAVPLLVHDEAIGLLAVYPERGRALSEDESALLSALAAQLAVAVQNARLHEDAEQARIKAEEERAKAERQEARTKALSQISRSFAESLSLQETLDAVPRAAVELLGVDAAVLRIPAPRGDSLAPRAVYVADERLGDVVRSILWRDEDGTAPPGHATGLERPLVLDAAAAGVLGSPYHLLVPFLEKGSTAAVLPVATQREAHGTLTVLSLDPARPIGDETVETALSLVGQAALALENARLYEQQRKFADAMQRSLLPRARPEVAGLELGDVYASSARLDVGGDVYDYLVLEDGRLAVVLGDVTGHGIDAAADMAMAKFVFRSLAREHSEPADFLAAANEVAVGEIGPAKFITMLYLVVDAARGLAACACAGHSPPRLIRQDASVASLAAQGLALGIEPGQVYDEVREELPVGAALVLFTDGVVEARRRGEQYGEERLDRLLAANAALPAQALAQTVLDECRAFSGGDLTDDCAVVVLKRTA